MLSLHIYIAPRKVRARTLQKMQTVKDSLVRYNYLAVASKTCMMSSEKQYHEEAGNYRQAYFYLKENERMDDSIRNERVRMRTADLALRYQ